MKEKFLSLEATPAHMKIPETPSPISVFFFINYNKQKKIFFFQRRSKRSLVPTDDVMSKRQYNSDESVSNMAGQKADKWNNFWVPQLATTAEDSKLEKPVLLFFMY